MKKVVVALGALIYCATGALAFADPSNGGRNGNSNPTPEQCAEVVGKLAPVGHQCNNMADFNARAQCFSGAPQAAGVDQGIMDACGKNKSLDSLKNQLISEEKSKYPDQPDALDNHNGGPGNGNGNQRGKGRNGNQGSNGNGNNGGSPMQVTGEQCASLAGKLEPIGHQCNTMADFNARSQCFSQAPQSAGVDSGVMDACSRNGSLDALKNILKAEEKSKYPNQPDAIDNHNGGSNNGNQRGKGHKGRNGNQGSNGGPNNMGNGNGNGNGTPGNTGGSNNMGNGNGGSGGNWAPDACQAQMSKVQGLANKCLGMADFNSRKSCFDQVPMQMPPGFMDGCHPMLDSFKNQIMSQEKQKYPTQPNALH